MPRHVGRRFPPYFDFESFREGLLEPVTGVGVNNVPDCIRGKVFCSEPDHIHAGTEVHQCDFGSHLRCLPDGGVKSDGFMNEIGTRRNPLTGDNYSVFSGFRALVRACATHVVGRSSNPSFRTRTVSPGSRPCREYRLSPGNGTPRELPSARTFCRSPVSSSRTR